MENQNLSFGDALSQVKEGKLIARSGWNGKGMFVFQRPEDSLQKLFVVEAIKSIPQAVKDYFASLSSDEYPVIKFTSYLCMKTPDNTIVNGWNASQSDMLANDWYILD